jgi:hypothetical protein
MAQNPNEEEPQAAVDPIFRVTGGFSALDPDSIIASRSHTEGTDVNLQIQSPSDTLSGSLIGQTQRGTQKWHLDVKGDDASGPDLNRSHLLEQEIKSSIGGGQLNLELKIPLFNRKDKEPFKLTSTIEIAASGRIQRTDANEQVVISGTAEGVEEGRRRLGQPINLDFGEEGFLKT